MITYNPYNWNIKKKTNKNIRNDIQLQNNKKISALLAELLCVKQKEVEIKEEILDTIRNLYI